MLEIQFHEFASDQFLSDGALQFLKILASVAPVSYRPVSYKKNVYDTFLLNIGR